MDFRRRIVWSIALPLFTLFLTLSCDVTASLAATGTIDATNHYAWNDNGGYVNWNATNGNVTVTDTTLTGYIWSAGFGWINLSPTLGGVTNNAGVLGGYAWGANTGWINFTGVTIDSNGLFHGSTVAQSLFGTMTFDCTYCNVTTTWRNSSVAATNTTTNTGGGGTISGTQSYGYESSTTGTSSAATTPPSLVPTSPPPPVIKPVSGPTSGVTIPAHLTPSITLSIYTSPTATVGRPLALNITFNNAKRTQNISYAYRLYRADGSIAYSQTGTVAPAAASNLSVSIPTAGLAAGAYTVGVSAQYGRQSIASETLPVSLYATTAEASAHVSDTTTAAVAAPSCSLLACWWRMIVGFFKRVL
ncbi:hypothetical protein [Bradyrhizobium sp. LTSP885]|uniref:hypothetical protein n=1 Tax=Bradyrhizobium sp. LTSP885 TaxID=1619232 RepID=UPI000B1BB6EB|nr:hypothetical protein [Bradyrhizobium sp. LTSP885]